MAHDITLIGLDRRLVVLAIDPNDALRRLWGHRWEVTEDRGTLGGHNLVLINHRLDKDNEIRVYSEPEFATNTDLVRMKSVKRTLMDIVVNRA